MVWYLQSRAPGASRLAPRLLGTFFAFATIMCTAAGWSVLAPDGPAASIWTWKPDQFRQMLSFGPIVGFGFLSLVAVMAVTCVGCFAGKSWGWRLAVAIIAINAVADGARALSGEIIEGVIGLVIAGGVLWGLLRPSVREKFRN